MVLFKFSSNHQDSWRMPHHHAIWEKGEKNFCMWMLWNKKVVSFEIVIFLAVSKLFAKRRREIFCELVSVLKALMSTLWQIVGGRRPFFWRRTAWKKKDRRELAQQGQHLPVHDQEQPKKEQCKKQQTGTEKNLRQATRGHAADRLGSSPRGCNPPRGLAFLAHRWLPSGILSF